MTIHIHDMYNIVIWKITKTSAISLTFSPRHLDLASNQQPHDQRNECLSIPQSLKLRICNHQEVGTALPLLSSSIQRAKSVVSLTKFGITTTRALTSTWWLKFAEDVRNHSKSIPQREQFDRTFVSTVSCRSLHHNKDLRTNSTLLLYNRYQMMNLKWNLRYCYVNG